MIWTRESVEAEPETRTRLGLGAADSDRQVHGPARPTAARPVLSSRSVVHIPHIPGLFRDGHLVLRRRRLYKLARRFSSSLLRDHVESNLDPRGYTRPRRPKAGRLPARHAHTCHAPSGFAAGALRPSLRPTDTPVSLRLPLPHSFSPSGWSGECIAASSARRPGDHSACQID
jgi:hypothetical protein